jgi:hypothetical protein
MRIDHELNQAVKRGLREIHRTNKRMRASLVMDMGVCKSVAKTPYNPGARTFMDGGPEDIMVESLWEARKEQ